MRWPWSSQARRPSTPPTHPTLVEEVERGIHDVAGGLPPGAEKIEHLIILMMENRSFDHYLGALALKRDDVEGLTRPPRSIPDNAKQPVPQWHMEGEEWFSGYADPPHGWDDQHDNYHNGANDGFVAQYQNHYKDGTSGGTLPEPAPANLPMGYYDSSTLPILYALADHFTVCDHWFSSVLSSTWPNRKYLLSGMRDADNDTQTLPGFRGFRTTPFLEALEKTRNPKTGNRYTWRNYFCDVPFMAFWYTFAATHALGNFSSILEFAHDCREDSLPTVSIIDPAFSLADDHPSHDVRLGQKFIGLVVDALTNSEAWKSSALVILYDENGGFYDHVPPPSGVVAAPGLEDDNRLGFRVPALIISPYVKPGSVCKTEFDHTSIMKSISLRWDIDFPNATYGHRWSKAASIWDAFDFTLEPKLGTYTQPKIQLQQRVPPPQANLNWGTNSHQLLERPVGTLESKLDRMLVVEGLKPLDRRSSVYDDLTQFEQQTVNLKRMNEARPEP